MKAAVFFATKADRDAAYASLKSSFVGTDNGVSGPAPDYPTAQWQIWATYDGDDKVLADALATVTKQQAVVRP